MNRDIIFIEVVVVYLRIHNMNWVMGSLRASFRRRGKGPVYIAEVFYDLKEKPKTKTRTKQFPCLRVNARQSSDFSSWASEPCLHLVSSYLADLICHCLPVSTLVQIGHAPYYPLNIPHSFLVLELCSYYPYLESVSLCTLCYSTLIL